MSASFDARAISHTLLMFGDCSSRYAIYREFAGYLESSRKLSIRPRWLHDTKLVLRQIRRCYVLDIHPSQLASRKFR